MFHAIPHNSWLLAALFLAGVVVVAKLWAYFGRDPQPGDVSDEPGDLLPQESNPLTPLEAATLLGCPEERGLLGLVLDLANRGVVRCEERYGVKVRRVLHVFLLPHSHTMLTAAERHVIATLFGHSKVVVLGNSSEHNGASWKARVAAKKELRARGIYDPKSYKRGYVVKALANILLIVVSMLLLFISATWEEMSSLEPLIFIAAMSLSFVIWAVLTKDVKGFSKDGATLYASWKLFQQFLEAGSHSDALAGQFLRLLPYAVAIGDVHAFIERYRSTDERLPSWYRPASATDHLTVPLLRACGQDFVAVLTNATRYMNSEGGSQ